MATRSVRLDKETERVLEDLVKKTGASLSELLKRGILALREREFGRDSPSPYEIYAALDLGPGGYAVAGSAGGYGGFYCFALKP
jgi:hypothetical protein